MRPIKIIPIFEKMKAIKETHFRFKNQTRFYRGKVRDVYYFGDRMAMVATDRISAFDVILPKAIPDKGRVLNLMASENLKATADLVPNWVLSTPDPNVTMGLCCAPFEVEMIVRGYLAGHAWREYKAGKRNICGVDFPSGLKENDPLPTPVITPTGKAKTGHDEDISREDILKRKIATEEDYSMLEKYALALYKRGAETAARRRLILADTKYEFGKHNGKIYLIDEVHTPDSSRYFYAEGFEESRKKGEPPRQLSKEFVRQWLLENGFQGKENQPMPEMTDSFATLIADRYKELFQQMTGTTLPAVDYDNQLKRIEESIINSLS